MKVERYDAAPEFAAVYVGLLPQFGVRTELAAWAEDYAAGHAGRCLWDARFLSRRLRGGRVLNIGGAPFLFEAALRRESPSLELVTVDLDPHRFPDVEGALGIRVIQGDIERPEWDLGEEFACIVLAEVFEHLHIDLLGSIARLGKHLAPDGALYLTTPNGSGFGAWHRHFLRGRTGPPPVREWEKIARLGHMGHVREYSLLEVTEVLAASGLRIEETLFRRPNDGRWPLRDTLIAFRPSLADELVILARREDR